MRTNEIYVFTNKTDKNNIITNDIDAVVVFTQSRSYGFKVIEPGESHTLSDGKSYTYEELKEMLTIFVKLNYEAERVEEVKYSYKFPNDFMKFRPVRFNEVMSFGLDRPYSYEELKSKIVVEV